MEKKETNTTSVVARLKKSLRNTSFLPRTSRRLTSYRIVNIYPRRRSRNGRIFT